MHNISRRFWEKVISRRENLLEKNLPDYTRDTASECGAKVCVRALVCPMCAVDLSPELRSIDLLAANLYLMIFRDEASKCG